MGCALIGLAALGLLPPHPPFGDPLNLHGWKPSKPPITARPATPLTPLATTASAAALSLLPPQLASAAEKFSIAEFEALNTQLDPKTFQPVCPASDGFYRFGQTLVVTTVGPESYKEYAPLIAGGLLRVRLELCVVESFFYEAIIPFIKENGLSWILPLHETVETFLAGTIFAIASNFILIGSTKIITVIFTYADVFFGLPLRIVGGAGWKALEDQFLAEKQQLLPPPPPRPWWKGPKPREEVEIEEVWKSQSEKGGQANVIGWGAVFGVGLLAKTIRQAVEALDVFVGRYLLLTTVAYVGIKFVHFKIFDPFPL